MQTSQNLNDLGEVAKFAGKATPVNKSLGTKETASIKVETQIVEEGLVFRAFPASNSPN